MFTLTSRTGDMLVEVYASPVTDRIKICELGSYTLE